MTSIKATVVTADGERITLALLCRGRSAADTIINDLYPDARYSSVIVLRRQQQGVAS